MTDQELFEDMLKRNDVHTRKTIDTTSNDKPCISLEIKNEGEKVATMSHCFCAFRFDVDGALLEISFGY